MIGVIFKNIVRLFFRENRHISAPTKTKKFKIQAFVNNDVYPSNSKQTKKFPVLNLKRNDTVRNPNRLVCLSNYRNGLGLSGKSSAINLSSG
jgi:hypothetical protein